MKPEEQAREQIDAQLQAAGWTVQSRDKTNLGAARGVAVDEFPLTTGLADYMLFVDHRSIGVVKAKKAGMTLSGVEVQTAWPAQIEAVQNLERSFALDRPRALIQMATGSGKTYTAVTLGPP